MVKSTANLCYDNGNIAYSEIDHAAAKGWTSIGRFPGEMKRFEGPIRFDSLTCLPVDALPPLPDWTRDRSIMRLRPEHGFLDLGPQRAPKNEPVRLVRNGSDKAIEVPIRRREFIQRMGPLLSPQGCVLFSGRILQSRILATPGEGTTKALGLKGNHGPFDGSIPTVALRK